MRFSRLRLNGFKSFVDPTDLIIHDGLTGVVGPNGCGKSNLLEALRWVMGENRPTAMRGGGMEDVIFAGAATRPARNFAEVSLTIDNTERLAPAGFNDEDSLEVVRRITRDIGSAYKANTKDVRARDVQMLFADASTGAHSPALVRQGQISELINAKPKARRRILEEAAGISGLYQRRHEAELKLNGAETNLARVDDVLEQLASQLTTLTRQAKQAERYKEIGAALRQAEGMLLYLRWKEAQDALLQAQEILKNSTLDAAKAEGAVRTAVKTREDAEAALPPLREEEAVAGAVLQRILVQQETLEGEEKRSDEAIAALEGRIKQLSTDSAREQSLNTDATETMERLKQEAKDLEAAEDGYDQKLETAQTQSQEAAEVLQTQETALSTMTEDVARLAARHQSAQRLCDDTQSRLTKAQSDEAKAKAEVDAAQSMLDTSKDRFEAAQTAETAAGVAVEQAETALKAAEAALSEGQSTETAARSVLSETQSAENALRAEVNALSKVIARDTSTADHVLDHISVEPGLEKSLGAALADDLKAPLIGADGVTGWAELADLTQTPSLPNGATAFAASVTAPAALTRRLQFIGLVDAADGARLQGDLQPGQRLVSREGDLWRWDGYRAGAEDAPSAAALRLEQKNKLKQLENDLTTAAQAAADAKAKHDVTKAELATLTEADRTARAARRTADQALAEAGRQLSKAEAEQNLSRGKLEAQTLAVTRFADEASAARAGLAQAEDAIKQLDDLDAARAKIADLKLTVEAARITMMSKRSAYDEMRREGDQRRNRKERVERDLENWEKRLINAATRASELNSRQSKAEAELEVAKARPAELASQRASLTAALADANARKKAAADALTVAETALREAALAEKEAERKASATREDRARHDARVEAAGESAQHAKERIAEDLQTKPEALLETLQIDPESIPKGDQVEQDLANLRRKRDALGAVNLRAAEDAKEVQTEFDTLTQEKADLEDAIKTLRGGIAGLNKEGRARLLEAFDEVNKNFGTLFTHLFRGGEANLVMVESDDPLEAGLEIMCQPPGKKLSTLSLLSGGEQTLTALALIFAVFLANPAPICVLDEVDAPLDDANVTRFCDLLDEMTRRTNTRFLIITHHAVTMARMDRLFGVTMAEQGVSQLVSVDLNDAERMVA
ncbi:MAG: chromosome segregation protein SMC [Planktomarina sp.]